MFTISVGLALLLCVLAVLQAGFVLGFARVLRRGPSSPLPDEECPRVAVLLSLRGADPFLKHCIDGLLTQDYPNFEVRIIVDGEEDPAWQVAQDLVAAHDKSEVIIEPLEDHRETCSLVNSSFVQGIQRAADSVDVIAVLDADVVPHRSWLRELVTPLADPDVGVSAGNRWYMPARPTWGALIRYVWNVGAVVQMFWNEYTWGGSLAVKRDVLQSSDLIEIWQKAFAFDTTIHDEVRRQGKKIAFAPSIIMVNRENCTLGNFFPWVQRQLLLSRLYHPGWPVVLAQGIFFTLVIAAGLILTGVAVGTQDWNSAAWLGGSLLFFLISSAWVIASLEGAVRKMVAARGDDVDWTSPGVLLKLLLALPLTQFVFGAALVLTTTIRNVSWRGIDYNIHGPYDVEMVEYRPFAPQSKDSLASL